MDEYAKIIQQLDQPMKMVKIDVTIVEASKDFAREVGIGITGVGTKSERVKFLPSSSAPSRDIFSEAAKNFDAGANPDAPNDPTVNAATPDTLTLYPLLETVAGTPISGQGITGTFLYWGSHAVLAATLQAAESRGISKTINQSSIVTMDNMQAVVDSTTTITYKLRSGGGDEAITVEDRTIDAGIVLETTPHIIETNDNRILVELVIKAEWSTFLATRTDDIPHEVSTALNTQAIVGDNNTLVIGGFFDNIYTRGETGIPCIMNIPVFGHLFKTASARNPKSNILFFLTPTVISLDKIPYEGPELKQKMEKYEKELKKIDGDRQEKYIEKYQD